MAKVVKFIYKYAIVSVNPGMSKLLKVAWQSHVTWPIFL